MADEEQKEWRAIGIAFNFPTISKPQPTSTMTPEESLERMRRASNDFYVAAANTNCHAFIEFTGLMNEYIKVCEANLARGIDFRKLNAHGSEQMTVQPYEVHYFNEKLNCIFQGVLEVRAINENEKAK